MLETKLHIPATARATVARQRLRERMARSAEVPLTLVSAPAGFGKSTLLAQWIAERDPDGSLFAWVSLDERDNDLRTFWTYLATAVNRVAPDSGSEALALLETASPSFEAVVSALINDLVGLDRVLTIVLDDYHLIETTEIHDSLAFFVTRQPANTHLVVSTRSDPPMPLAQMRARRGLLEVRAGDLRFTAHESTQYLNDAMGLNLSGADIEALDLRTEGWIAALQLAALSIEGRDDATDFIASFAGDDRYIVDYLAEEVLQRQDPDVRDFLLRTSVLDQFNGPLCDAVTGGSGGKARLASLDRQNLFLVALDDRREWYRYHHLFADVLRAHLIDETPDLVPSLDRAASTWFEAAGDAPAAIRHAIASGDVDRVAHLVELAAPGMQRRRQEVALRDWIDALPGTVVRSRPVLSNIYAGTLLSTGQFARVEGPLADAERYAEALSGATLDAGYPPPIVADQEQYRRLPAGTAVHRAGLHLVSGDLEASVESARRALSLAGPDEHLERAASTALIGLATWTMGNLVDAEQAYRDCLADMAGAGHLADVLGCSIALADIQIALGLLSHAEATYHSGLRLATGSDSGPLRGTCDMLTGLAEVNLERGEVENALDHLSRAHQLGDRHGLPQYPYRQRVVAARIREATGDIDGAISLLSEADSVFTTDFSPDVHPLGAQIARLQLRLDRIREAEDWARHIHVRDDESLTYVREFEHITLARLLVARHDGGDPHALERAISLLTRLEQSARAGSRTSSLIEILVITAIALQARGSGADAITSLRGALALAEPEGHVRPFTTEGPSLGRLVEALPSDSVGPRFLTRIEHPAPAGSQTGAGGPSSPLADPLSGRELDVLRLLATELSGPEIARHLFISHNTMRSHTKRIFTKLGVSNRRAAVARAQHHGLI